MSTQVALPDCIARHNRRCGPLYTYTEPGEAYMRRAMLFFEHVTSAALARAHLWAYIFQGSRLRIGANSCCASLEPDEAAMAFLEKRLRACADDIPSVHATLFAAPLDFTHEQAWALASILAQARFPNEPLDLVPSLTPSLPLPDGMGPSPRVTVPPRRWQVGLGRGGPRAVSISLSGRGRYGPARASDSGLRLRPRSSAGLGTCEVPVGVASVGGSGRGRRAERGGEGAVWTVALPRRSLRLGAGRGTRELVVLADGRVDLTGPD